MVHFTSRNTLFSLFSSCLVFLFSSFTSHGQAVVSGAFGGDQLCVGPAYTTISPIVITEGQITDFSFGASPSYLYLQPTDPAFEYLAGSGVATFTTAGSPDVSVSISMIVTATRIEVTLTENSAAHLGNVNTITISGIQVKATSAVSAETIERTASSQDLGINGFAVNDPISSCVLTSYNPPTVNAGADDVSCYGAVYNFPSATTTNGTLVWTSNGTGSIGSPTTATPTYTPGPSETGNITFTLTVTGSGSCGTVQDTKVVAISTPVVASAGAAQAICDGSSTTLGGSPTATGGSAPYTYTWNAVAGPSNPVVNPSSTTTYNLVVTDANGCVDNTQSVTVTVNPIPATPSISGGPVNQCQGVGTVTLTEVGPGTNFRWYKDGIFTGQTGSSIMLAEVPASTGNYTVSVTDVIAPTFCESLQSAPVNVTFNPLPSSAPVVTPATTQVCSGGTVSITVNGTQAGINYQVFDGGVPVSGIVAGTGGAIGLVTSALVSGVTLTVKATQPSSGCTVSLAPTVVVTVNPLPVANAGGPVSVCQGLTATLTGSGSGGTGPYSYSWSPAVGLSATNISNPVFNGLSSASYTLTVTDAKSCVSTPGVAAVTVNPKPVADAGADKNVCSGLTVGLNGSATGGNGTYSYSWSPTTDLDDALIATPVFSGLSTTVYTLTVTDGNGCIGTDVMTVTVNPLPVADAGAARDICFGSSTTLGGSPASSGGDGAYSYLWTGGSTASNPAVSPASTTTYNLTVTDGNGCVDNTQSVLVTVNPLPTPTLIATATAICAGTNVTFTAGPGAGPAVATYTFRVNGPIVQGPLATTTYASSTLASGDVVTVTATTGTTPACSVAAAPITMTVNAVPTPTLIASATSICAGTSVTFTAGPGAGPAITNYDFKVGAASVQSGLSNIYTSSALANGDVVTVVATSGTGPSCNVTSAGITMTVNALPTPTLIATATAICAGTNVTFTAGPGAGPAVATYTFRVNGSIVQGPLATTTYASSTLASGDIVTVTATTGTTPACSVAAAPITMTVNAVPTPTLIASATSICAGTSVTFTAGPGAGPAITNYNFFVGAASVQSGLSNIYTSSALANGDVVTVVATSGTGPSCNVTSAGITMTVNALPTPTLIATATAICAGTNVTFTAGPGAGPAVATYTFRVNGSIVQGPLATTTYASSTLASGDIVTVTATTGTTPACSVAAAPITMTVNAVPTPTLIASATSICAGTSVTFTAGPGAGPAITNYDFKVGAASVQSGLSNIYTSSALANGDVVTVVATSGTGPSCNVTSAGITMTVNALPTPTLIATATAICAGTNVTFTAGPGAGPAVATYTFRVNGSIVQGPLATTTYASSTLASGDIVTVTATTGTTPACSVAAAPITMTVNAVPTPTLIASATSICAGTSVTFTAGPGAGPAITNYDFKVGAASVQSGLSNIYTSSALANGDVVTVVATSGTGPSCNVTSAGITMTVNALPTPTLIATATAICAGTNVTFTAGPGAGPAVATYTFRVNGSIVQGPLATTTYASSTLASGDVVTVTATTGTTPACSVAAAPITMTVNAVPTPTLIASATSICAGTSVTFTAGPGAGPAITNYDFKVGAASVQSGLSNIYTSSALANGDVVTVVATSGTGPSCNVTSAGITMTVNALPTPTLIATATAICAGTNVTFTAGPGAGPAVATYTFRVNGSIVQGPLATTTYASSTLASGDIVTVTATTGTTPACSVAAAPITMTVNAVPTPTLIASATSICAGTSVTFTAGPGAGPAITNYDFKVGAASVQSGLSNIYTSSALANGDVVTVVATSGTGPSCNVTSAGITMTVNALPTPTLIATATAICAGTNVTFTAGPGAGPAVATYTFRVNGSIVQGPLATTTYASSTLASGDIVTVTATTGTTPACSVAAAPITMTVNAVPTPTLIASATSICAGTSVTFTAGPGAGPAITNYDFKVGAASVQSGLSNIYTSSALANGDVVTVVATSGTGPSCNVTSAGITMTVNALPTPTLIATATAICAGTNVTFTAGPGAGPAVATYTFRVNGSIVQGPLATTTYASSTLASGDIVTVTATTGTTPACSVAAAPITMTVNAVPTPTLIASATSICAGTSVTFTAGPGAGPAITNYDFKVGAASVQSGLSNIYTSSALANGDVVTVVATSGTGPSCNVTSAGITMTVNALPTPTLIATATAICAGTNVTFTAGPGAGPAVATYTFRVNGSIVQGPLATTTYASSTLASGDVVTVTATTGTTPACSVAAAPITMTVNAVPTPTLIASATSICAGTSVTFTAGPGAGPAITNYDFKVGAASVQSGLSNIYTSSALANGDVVTVVATSGTGPSCNVTSAGITMTVNALPTPTLGASATTICANTSVLFTATNGGGPAVATYTFAINGTPVQGPSATATYSTTTLANGDVVTVTATTGTTPACSATATPITMTVNPRPVVTAGQTKTICSGDNINYKVTLTPGGFPFGTTYTWPAPTMSAGGAQGSSGLTVPESNVLTITETLVNTTGSPITATYSIAPTSGAGCTGTSVPVVITINPAPVVTASQAKTICSGSTVDYKVTLTPGGTPAGTFYNWPAPTMSAGGPQGTPGSAVLESAVFTITDLLVNTTGSPITATYNITPRSSAGCVGATVAVVITVGPAPVITAGQTKTICSGANVNYKVTLTPAGAPPGTTFSWPLPTMSDASVQGTVGTAVSSAAVPTINDPLVNTSGSPITATYVITPTNAGCVGNPVNVVITVNPSPVITAGQVKTVCSGSDVNYKVKLTPGGLPSGTTYTWPAPTMSVGGPQGTAGTAVPEANPITITDILTNFTGNPITATYNITPTSAAGCAGSMVPVVITVNPAPVITPSQTSVACSGTPVNYKVTLTPGGLPTGTRYTWPTPTMSAGAPQGTSGSLVPESNTFTITDVLVNTTGAPITATYAITPSTTLGCTGAMSLVVITINPAPVITAGQTKTICSGANIDYKVTLTPAGLPAGTTYSWPLPTMSDASVQGAIGTAVPESNVFTIVGTLVNTTGSPITATYVITPTNAGCVGAPVNVVITVNPSPVITAGQVKTICSGANVNYKVTLTPAGLPGGTTYSWPLPTMSAGAAQGTTGAAVPESNALTITDNLVNTTGTLLTATYVITPTRGGCAGLPVNVVITVNPAPVVTASQTKTICSGANVNYKVTLTPAGLPAGTTYSWPLPTMSAGGPQGTAGSGVAEAAALTITDLLINTTGSPITATYNITPTSSLGCIGAMVPVVITINPAPVITAGQTKTICSGANIDYKVTLTPAGLPAGTTYSWPLPTMSDASVQGAIGTAVPESNVFTIVGTLVNTTGSPITATYVITPTNGGCVGAPVNVVITVNPSPVITAGQVKTICSGANVNYKVTLTPAGLPGGTTYSWPLPTMSVGAAQGTAGAAVPESNALTITDNLVNTTGTLLTATYVITPTRGGCAGLPVNVVITVNPAPVVTASQTKTICSGANVNYKVTLTPAGLPAGTTYSWPLPTMSAGGPQGTAGSGVAEAAALTITDLLINTTGSPITATYNITPTSSLGCAGAMVPVVITINPAPVITAGQTKTICSGANIDYKVTLTPAGLPAGTTYSWPLPTMSDASVQGAIGTAVPESNVFTIVGTLVNTTGSPITATYVITPTNAGCVGAPVNVVITVNPAPVVTASQTKTICSGANVNYKVTLTPAGLPAGTTYSWPLPTMSVGAAQGTAGAAVPESNALTITDNLVNTTGTLLTATYVITPTRGGCAGLPVNVVITVNPAPVVTASQTKTICSGANVNYKVTLTPAGLPAGTTYSWPLPTMSAGGPQGTAGSGVAEAAALTITDLLINTTGSPITATYNITPTSSLGCIGAMVPVVITINPAPVITAGQTKTICSGANIDYKVTLTPAGLPAGTTYSWPLPTMSDASVQGAIGTAVPESNVFTIVGTLVNTTGSPITATYVITPTNAGCVGAPVNVVITVNPAPVVTASQTKTICSGANVNYKVTLTPAGLPAGTTYSWPLPTMSAGAAQGTTGAAVPESNALTITDNLVNTTGTLLTATYVITPTRGGCAGLPVNVVITVNPAPVVTASQTKTICSGANVNYKVTLTPAGLPAGTTYSWPLPTMSAGGPQGTAGSGVAEAAALTITDLLINTTGSPITATYNITPTSSLGCIGAMVPVVITINPAPVITAGQTKTICSGANIDYKVTLTPAGLPAGTTYSWPLPTMSDASVQGAIGTAVPESNVFTIVGTLVNTTGSPITATYVITPTNGGCVGAPVNVVITVNPSPVITAGQVKTICSGANVNYKVTLTPAGLPGGTTYSWPLPTMSVGAAQGTAGAAVPESNALTITDNLVNTTGTLLTATYVITPTRGGCAGLPVNVVITVNPAPVVTASQTKTICSGANVNYKVTLTPAGLPAGTTYSWPLPTMSAGGPQGTAGSGVAEAAALTITDLLINTTGSPITATYNITPTSSLGCIGAMVPVVITINPAPVITAGQSKTICSGANIDYKVTLTPAGLPAGTTYSWPLPTMSDASVQGAIGTAVPESNVFTIVGTLVNTTGSPITATYVITPTNGGCVGAPVNVVITVNPAPVVTASQTKTICSGANVNYKVTLTPAGLPAGTTYSWPLPTMSAGAAQGTAGAAVPESNALTITDNLVNTTGSLLTATYVITPTRGGCAGLPVNVVITVNPAPVVTASQTKTICSGANVNYKVTLTPAGLPAGTTYSWPLPTMSAGGPQGTAGSGVAEAAALTITDLLINTTGSPITATYNITPTSSLGCAGAMVPVVITINPAPVITAGQTKMICSGANIDYKVTLTPAGLPAGTTYSWPLPTMSDASVQGAIGTAVPESNVFTIVGTLVNTTGSPITATYVITPTNAGCVGAPVNVVITVDPSPVIVAGQVKTICSNTNVNYRVSLTPGGFPAGTKFSWPLPTMSVGGPQGSAGSLVPESNPITIGDNLLNLNGSPITATYNITPTSPTGCAGTPVSVVITINPEPVGTTASKVICSDLPVSYNLQTNVNASNGIPSNFLWSAAANPNVTGESTTARNGNVIDDVLTNTTLTTTPQIVVYTVTPTSQATGCVGSPFTINVTVNARAKIDAGLDIYDCNTGPVPLAGNAIDAPAGWLWSGGGGMFSNSASLTSTYTMVPSELNSSTFKLTLTALDPDGPGPSGPCGPETDDVHLVIYPIAVASFSGFPGGSPPQIAQNDAPITLLGSGVTTSITSGLFTVVSPATTSIGTTAPSPIPADNNRDAATFDPSAATLGLNTIRYTYLENHSTPYGIKTCTSLADQVVNINPVTVIDFSVQGATINALNEFEICAETGLVKLNGSPAASTGVGPTTTFVADPGSINAANTMTINKIGAEYYINTAGLKADVYVIRYIYLNSLGATSTKARNVKVYAAPTAGISVANSCIASAIVFTDNSSVSTVNFPTTIINWKWDFADGSFSNQQNPSHFYGASGTYNITLDVTSAQGCKGTATQAIRVGDVPVVDFNWSAICNNDSTKFADKTNPGAVSTIQTYTWTFGDGDVLTGPAAGAIPPGTNGGRTSGTYMKPDHKYVSFGTFNSKLIVDTNDGCTNSITQKVFILPYSTVTPIGTNAYREDFEANNGGWIAEAKVPSDTSWIWTVPNGANIKTAASGAKAWWTGRNNNTYYTSEQSVVNGPCFDLRQLKRPMVALDYWSDSESNIDGAVMQYSVDGGVSWRIIGPAEGVPNRDQGINWFNGQGIPSNPGMQPLGNYGWTDKSGGWKNARFNMDMIPVPERDQVRLRVAFASNGTNPPQIKYDGFAFDNFFVGDKTRNVLVEHFTNSSLPASVNGDTWINNLYDQAIATRGVSDFYNIQYHVGTPNVDPLNVDNPTDPAARAIYFGASQPPATIMDGILNGKFKGLYTDLDQTGIEVDRRALVDPLFDLQLQELTASAPNKISVKVTATAKQSFNAPVIVQVALLEKQVGTFRNVLRKQLAGADGETITLAFTAGNSLVKQYDNVDINVPIANPGQLLLVAYVQDKNTREIYQSIVIPAASHQGTVTVGLGEQVIPTTLNGISIYPIPANGSVYLGLPEGRSADGFTWKLSDERGAVVRAGEFDGLVNNAKQIDVSGLADGLYIMMLSGPGKSVVHRKIMIMNRN